MNDSRLQLLNNWLQDTIGNNNFYVIKINNDASFRRYFRITLKSNNNTSFIAMDAPPEKEDSHTFTRINKYLITNNIKAPKIIAANLNQGFLLLEDFGDTLFLNNQQQKFNIDLYKTAIDILIKIQSINTKLKNIPQYDNTLLNTEMQLFISYYLPTKLGANNKNKLAEIFSLLSINALSAKQVLVHRDYHSCNLMLLANKKLGVLDFQDATVGCYTYDLVSLLKDAYFKLELTDIQTLLQYYYQQAKITTSFAKFEEQFDLMGVQRHLKILGIFKRLYIRDHKDKYLKYIPQVVKYILHTTDKYKNISLFKKILCVQ